MLSLIRNFLISIRNIFRKPRTVAYTGERIIIPEGSRGVLHLKLDLDTLEIICNGCGLCKIICPQKCIEVKKRVGGEGKEILDEFYLDLRKCIFCGNCVEFCEMNAINMSYRYQLAEHSEKDLKLEKVELIKPSGVTKDFW
jgi:NADH-quinone oxidoreductase subunit I